MATTIKPKIVEPDVPQELLDMANERDWTRVPSMMMKTGAIALDMYIKKTLRLPMKPKGHVGRSDSSKRVAIDVPQALLDRFNGVDWNRMTAQQIRDGLDRLRREGLPKLPVPKK